MGNNSKIYRMTETPDWIPVFAAGNRTLSGSFRGNLVSDWLKKKAEKDKLRKDLIDKYLINCNMSSNLFRTDFTI